MGGAIHSRNSLLSFTEKVTFESNSAEFGGAFYMLFGSSSFSNNTLFTHNSASRNGGAFYGLNSNMTVKSNINIIFNSAQNGGAMYLESGAFFTISHPIELSISQNSATEYGGAIYHQDTVTPFQCNFVNHSHYEPLPYCFLQFKVSTYRLLQVQFINNSASRDGNF